MSCIIHNILQIFRRNIHVLKRLLPIFFFVIPFLILFSLYPESFERTWKGRTYYLFFLWIFFLEIIMSWEELQSRTSDKKLSRKIALFISLFIPTVYVIVANFFGLNYMIEDLAEHFNMAQPWASEMSLSTEYLVLAVFFALIISLEYGSSGLKDFSVSTIFLVIIGVVFTVDNLYPYGRLTPLQFFVPTTATLAAYVLRLLGYETRMSFTSDPAYGFLPSLWVGDSQGRFARFGIAWPCAGVESLLIYTITTLLLLKKTGIPWKHRIIYFIIGAIVTYFINVLRIATIFVIAINHGRDAALRFHDYYGQLYSISWIVSYPLIIIGSRVLWRKIRKWKIGTRTRRLFSGLPDL